jgi:lipid A 4'-phosphatase
MSSAQGARRWRGSWEPESLCLVAIALLTTLLFASGSLDIAAARWFYRPAAADHWPLARQLPWSLLYRAASWITATLVIGALAAFAASLRPARRHWRRYAVLVLLAVAIGPGLLGNALFKDHWQHPRPRDLIQLGGALHYVPAPLIGHEGGASFPCGHCTVGFLYGAGWWIWRSHRRRLAATSLALGLTLGVLLGISRMAAGAHFLSDVIWSALLAFGVTHLLSFHVLRVPQQAAASVPAPQPQGASAARGERWLAVAALAGGATVLLALFAAPHGTELSARLPVGSLSTAPRLLEVDADTANITIVLADEPAGLLTVEGELHGFGLPTSRLDARLEVQQRPPPPRVRYRIEERGWLTDVDGAATLHVPASAFDRLIITVQRGDIRVTDGTRAAVVAHRIVRLELHTARGHVRVETVAPGAATATDRA